MIKQMIPVPDNLTPVELVVQENGEELWEDTARNGTVVLLALTDKGEVLPYVTGVGDLDPSIRFRPAVRCPACGQKMWILPHADCPEQVAYECPCGKVRRVKIG